MVLSAIPPQRQCCNPVVCTAPPVIMLLLKWRSSCLFPFPRKGRGAVAAHLCLECGAASLECSLEWGWEGLRLQLQPPHVLCSWLGASSGTPPWTKPPWAHSQLTLATSWGLGTLRRSQRQLRLSLTTGSSASLPGQRLFPVNSDTSTQLPEWSMSPLQHSECGLPCTFQMAGAFVVSHLRTNGHFCTALSQINHQICHR